MDAEYNDILEWNYKGIVDVFGGQKTCKKHVVKTKDELNELLTDAEFNAAANLQFVELHMPKKDAPRALVLTAEASARVNAKLK